jgi:hypothetical protein
MRRDIEFNAEGLTLRGWFYVPDGEEDEILSCSAAAHTVTRDVSYGSGANEGNQRSAAGK